MAATKSSGVWQRILDLAGSRRTGGDNAIRPGGHRIPKELSLERILRNATSAPCSLDNFMDYLVYVDGGAENLQFLMWFSSYLDRWSKLSPEQRPPSPALTAGGNRISGRRALPDQEGEQEKRWPSGRRPSRNPRSGSKGSKGSMSNFSHPLTPEYDGDDDGGAQPFRDELDRVVQHYIRPNGPRRLSSLSTADRQRCLDAARQTTHPSALLPAAAAAEAYLRSGGAHERFVRWSMRNAQGATLVTAAVAAALVALAGLALDAVLIASRAQPMLRLACIPVWAPAFAALVAALRGMSLTLHLRGCRALTPWEVVGASLAADGDLEAAAAAAAGADALGIVQEDAAGRAGGDDYDNDEVGDKEGETVEGEGKKKQRKRPNLRIQTGSTPIVTMIMTMEPGKIPVQTARAARKPAMQPLGPANDSASWEEQWRRRPFWRRAFWAETEPIDNAAVRRLQNREVVLAVASGIIAALFLGAASVFIPAGRRF